MAKLGASVTEDSNDVIAGATVIILAVKPGDVRKDACSFLP